jgi:AAHS family 4-hydroxybenzoate transporter-like MFS transporter
MRKTVDVAALLDRSSWSTYQKLLTALAALAIIFDGFDIQILGFCIPSLMQEWHVARSDFGPVLAVGLAGMAIGGPVAGYCGDRFGRRSTLIVCVAIFGLATMATAFVHGLTGLTLLRIATGMGTGGALPNAGTLTAEFAPLRRRPAAVKLTMVCVPLGGMLGGLLAARVLPIFGWRGLYAIGGALPLLFAALMWAALPESPRFLVCSPAWGTKRRTERHLRIGASGQAWHPPRRDRFSCPDSRAIPQGCGSRSSSAWGRSIWCSGGCRPC